MRKFDYQSFKQTPLPAEKEIMLNWRVSDDAPIVSILCVTFNQQTYIEDAIRGFLIQKTDFPFEIIIHDDASTDSTPAILIDYAKRYPKLIKLILQKENQYSQGKKVSSLAAKHASGLYLAFCEGDDFWIDEYKLRQQKKVFDVNPLCSLVIHQCLLMSGDYIDSKPAMGHGSLQRIIEKKEVIGGQGQFSPTASYLLKKEIFDILPEWFQTAPVGDYFIECYSFKLGEVVYLPEPFSIYRVNAIGSWSSATSDSGDESKKVCLAMYNSLELMGQDEFFFNSGVERKMALSYVGVSKACLRVRSYDEFTRAIEKSWKLHARVSKVQRLLYVLKNAPVLANLMLVMHGKLKG
ncbi:MAG: glycosyltransferase [Cycloclasticus sp.]